MTTVAIAGGSSNGEGSIGADSAALSASSSVSAPATLACAVRQVYYSSVPEVISSDHKPVVGGFEVAVGPAVLRLGGWGLDGDVEEEGSFSAAVVRGCGGMCTVM